jgi:hypothetical protein
MLRIVCFLLFLTINVLCVVLILQSILTHVADSRADVRKARGVQETSGR